ncbi:hypothetical protein OM076_30670 [Solirubrobacter ginsenosidimutans]|uniref:Uncharacterized protein n=1 Tax=Solirubrobacter ginsenosidimutans TaxID=490573 RepID=A0A9X3S5Z3_9ACTN|nr:hypothetical protein [Solirubrobacter ginsenosidimutans]MDA0164671.1 hypothetical protein [Solirubrobacter ginsenosidimutans]
MRWVCAATAMIAWCSVTPAYGQSSTRYLDWRAGDTPYLHAVPGPKAWAGKVEVVRCPAGGACESTPTPMTPEGYVDLTAIAAGDSYEARWSEDDMVVKAVRTPPWLGPYVVTAPPAVAGVPAVGGTLSAVLAEVSGGWGAPWGPFSGGSLAVCRSPQATDCQVLGEGSAPVLISERWTGWYAFATTGFVSGQSHPTDSIPVYAKGVYPYAVESLQPSARRAVSAPAGPIATATATIRDRALRREHRLSVARVTCPLPCSAQFKVSGGGEKAYTQTVAVTGLAALTIPPRHGKLRVRVTVDGKLLASGTSVAR